MIARDNLSGMPNTAHGTPRGSTVRRPQPPPPSPPPPEKKEMNNSANKQKNNGQGDDENGGRNRNSRYLYFGPKRGRILRSEENGSRMTDCIWAILFYLMMIITIILSSGMIKYGKPELLSHPFDPDGRPCGMGDIQDFPYIYFVTPSKEYLYRSVCVKQCPQPKTQPQLGSKLECAPNSVVDSCNFFISPNGDRDKEVLIYDTKLYIGKICMPRNVSYFTLISNALHMDKLQLSLSDLRISYEYLIAFGLIAVIISYLTKYMIDSERSLPVTTTIFFFVSTIGFFTLGAFFAFRYYQLIYAKPPDNKKVVEDDSVLQDTVTSSNTSPIFNLTVAIVCFLSCWVYLKNTCCSNSSSGRNGDIFDRLRNQMLLFVSDIIKKQGMMYIPMYIIIVYIGLVTAFFIVETNAYAVGKQVGNYKTLPFNHFTPIPLAQQLNYVILLGFFWAFIFIIQVGQYLSLKQSIRHLDDYLYPPRQSQNQSRYQNDPPKLKGPHSQLWSDIRELLIYRVGTIAKCSIYQFFFYYPRLFFETIDTSYSRKLNELVEETGAPNTQSVPHSCMMHIQRGISICYKATFLKSVQPYGFIYTLSDQMNFSPAGEAMQNKIDDTSYWFEDILDQGELFESQIKHSICFLTSLGFYLTYLSQAQTAAQVISPTIFMVITSYFISEVYVNTYGQVFTSFVLYFLVGCYTGSAIQNPSNNDTEVRNFADFIDNITSADSSNPDYNRSKYNQNPRSNY